MRILAHVGLGACCCIYIYVEEEECWSKTLLNGGAGVITPENGVTTALSWLTVSSSLMVQSQLASQAVTELGRPRWVSPPFSIWCQLARWHHPCPWQSLAGIGDALDRQRLKPMVPFLCGWVTHDAAAMRRDRNGD